MRLRWLLLLLIPLAFTLVLAQVLGPGEFSTLLVEGNTTLGDGTAKDINITFNDGSSRVLGWDDSDGVLTLDQEFRITADKGIRIGNNTSSTDPMPIIDVDASGGNDGVLEWNNNNDAFVFGASGGTIFSNASQPKFGFDETGNTGAGANSEFALARCATSTNCGPSTLSLTRDGNLTTLFWFGADYDSASDDVGPWLKFQPTDDAQALASPGIGARYSGVADTYELFIFEQRGVCSTSLTMCAETADCPATETCNVGAGAATVSGLDFELDELHLSSDAPAEIVFGSLSDTNLYRTSANRLKTDDDLEVAIDLDVSDGTYNGGHLFVGSVECWDDGTLFRCKDGTPSSATDGTPIHTPAYSHLYQHDSGTTVGTAAAGQNVWVQVDGFSCGVTTGLTCSTATDDITVDKTGDYEINWSVSFEGAANEEAEGGIGINGTVDTSTTAHRSISNANDKGNMAAVTVLSLTANDTVELQMMNESASPSDFTVDHAHVTVVWLGE